MHINSVQPNFKGEYTIEREIKSPKDLALLHYVADKSHFVSRVPFDSDRNKYWFVPIVKVNYDYKKMNVECNGHYDKTFEEDLATLGINFEKRG